MTGGPLQSVDRAELVFALGVVAVLVSGLLPWLTATEPIPVANPSERADGLSSFSEADTATEILGIDRVEWIAVAGVGIVATAIVLTEPWSRVVLAVGGVSAVAAIYVSGLALSDPVWMYSDWLEPEIGAVTSVGTGAYLALGGGALQAVGCYLGTRGPAATGARSLGRGRDRRQSSRQNRRDRQSQDEQQSAQEQSQDEQQSAQQDGRNSPQQDQSPGGQPQSGRRRSPERENESDG